MDFDLTKRVLAALEQHGVRYAIFGAVALNLHGLARFTADRRARVEGALRPEGLMPVRKYRSIYEMPDETWREPGDPLLYRAIREVWDFGRRTSGRRYPPGVYRFRSIDEMDVAQDDWDRLRRAAPKRPHPGP